MSNCKNVKKCVCPKTGCQNYGRCCACVIKHRTTDSIPFCMFVDNGGNKSNRNYYNMLKKRFEDNGGIMSDKEKARAFIRAQYAKAAKREAIPCCGGECGCNGTALDISAVSKKLGYTEQDFFDAPYESNMALGCGNPIAVASLKNGETVLDLGSGGGFDCFIARKKVGETGYVIGVDMTYDMINLARKNAEKSGYKNVDFRLGEIENLPVADNTADIVISNCVINLSLNKERVYKEAFRALKSGGRLSISDIVATSDIPKKIRNSLDMVSRCIGGAEHIDKTKEFLQNAGFKNIRLTLKNNSAEIVKAWIPSFKIEDYIASAVIEAEK